MSKRLAPEITVYNNGFVARFLNRRIECLLINDDSGDYEVRWIRASKDNPATEEELSKIFSHHFKKIGITVTVKRARLSKESIDILSSAWSAYNEEKLNQKFVHIKIDAK